MAYFIIICDPFYLPELPFYVIDVYTSLFGFDYGYIYVIFNNILMILGEQFNCRVSLLNYDATSPLFIFIQK